MAKREKITGENMTDEQRIKAAVQDLVSDNRDQSVQGYRVLKEYGGAAASIILQIAHDWDERQQIRWLGLYSSGGPTDLLAHIINDTRAVEPLSDALRDPNSRFRGFAAFTLVEIDDPRVPDLLAKAILDEDSNVRRNAIWGLGRLGDQRSYDLIKLALQDPDKKVRSSAARALRWVGGQDSTDILINALGDPSYSVVSSAVMTLGFLGDETAIEPLITVLKSNSESPASSAAEALANIRNPRAVEPLLETLKTSRYEFVRSSVARALVKFGPVHALEPFKSMICDPDYQLRGLAVSSLGKLGDRSASDAIADALQDDNPKVAKAAAFALASLGDKRAFDPLVSLLLIEPKMVSVRVDVNPDRYEDVDMNRATREIAARTLGILGDTRAIDPLASMLKDQHFKVQLAVARSLGQLGDDRGFHYLLNLLKSGERKYIVNILTDLGETRDSRAVESLSELCKSESSGWALKLSALAALRRIGTEEAVRVITDVMASGGKIVLDAAAELAKLGLDTGFDYLLSEISSEDEEQRVRVMYKLGFIENPRTTDLLKVALEDESGSIRAKAASILGKIGDKSAIACLKSLMDDQDRRVSTAAHIALNRILASEKD